MLHQNVSLQLFLVLFGFIQGREVLPRLKNKLFQLCFLITFLAMTTNIVSTLLIYQLSKYTIMMGRLQIPIKSISVNFSTSEFLQLDLMERMTSILKKHDIGGSLIKIEITESTLSENVDAMMRYALMMNTLGIRLNLDDFGTGYSNTASVLTFPMDPIKLDKSLICSAM